MQPWHHKAVCKIVVHTLIALGKQTQPFDWFSHSHIPLQLILASAGSFHIFHTVPGQLFQLGHFPFHQNAIAVYIPAEKQILRIAQKIVKHFVLFFQEAFHLVLIFLLKI